MGPKVKTITGMILLLLCSGTGVLLAGHDGTSASQNSAAPFDADPALEPKTLSVESANGDKCQVKVRWSSASKYGKTVSFQLLYTELSAKTIASFHEVEKNAYAGIMMRLLDRDGSKIAEVNCPMFQFDFDHTGLHFQGEIICGRDNYQRIASATVE